jgi:hypothetical protein
MSFTNKDKKLLFEKISTLSRTEHEEIFKIIKDKTSYSKNNNGVFFNMSSLPSDIIGEIKKFVDYCLGNKKDLDEYDKKINDCKMNITLNITLQDLSKTVVPQPDVEDWTALANETKSSQRVLAFVESVITDRDKTVKKKVNLKFTNAKKKYAKRAADRKYDSDTELDKDEVYENMTS